VICRASGQRDRAKIEDPGTEEVVGYSVTGPWGIRSRVIWVDGRVAPPDYVEHTFTGFSVGRCERGMLVVTTTHMKTGYHRRNGVPASNQAKMTEYFVRHGSELTHVQFTEDPVYLAEPYVRTTDFQLSATQNARPTENQEIVDEIATWDKGYVPSFPMGERHDEFAESIGVPLEATEGRPEAMYPEYLPRLRKMMAATKAAAPARTGAAGSKD